MFKLIIRTSNAAFEPCVGDELARILRQLAQWIEGRDGDLHGPIIDINGNTVGEITLDK